MFKRHKREALTLRRDLGFFEATAAGVGIIVGAGIYVLIGAAAGHAGNAVWLSFIISAFVAFLTGLSYAELSSIYTEDSGEYSYIEHNFSKRTAFIVGYLVILSLIIGAAAVSLGFAGYLNNLIGFNNTIITAIIAILVFSIINFIGIKQSMKVNLLFTALSILGLLMIIMFSLPRFGSVDYFVMPKDFSGVLKAASLIFFAYIGFESVIKLTEETKNPRKTIPLALLSSLGISTVFYILVAFSAISVIGWERLSLSSAPLAEVAQALMGKNVYFIVSLIAIVSTGNTIIMSLIALSRMLYSMSQDYVKLKFISRINKFTKTPYIAVIISGFLTVAFVFFGNIETVAEITNFSIFIVFSIVNLALIKSRYKQHKHEIFHSPFNIGKFPIFALLGFITSILMIFNLSSIVIIAGSIMMFIGSVLYKLLGEKN